LLLLRDTLERLVLFLVVQSIFFFGSDSQALI
jgi:hypothetical protein